MRTARIVGAAAATLFALGMAVIPSAADASPVSSKISVGTQGIKWYRIGPYLTVEACRSARNYFEINREEVTYCYKLGSYWYFDRKAYV